MDENNMSALSNLSVVNKFPKFSATGKTDAEVDYETSYRIGVKEIEKLLKKDKSTDKPKKLFDSNFKPTKKALKYNRKLYFNRDIIHNGLIKEFVQPIKNWLTSDQ